MKPLALPLLQLFDMAYLYMAELALTETSMGQGQSAETCPKHSKSAGDEAASP